MASANLHLARLDPRMSLHLSPDDWDLHTDGHLQKSKSIHSTSYACFKHVKNPLILSNQYSCVPRCLFTPFKCRSPVQLAGSLSVSCGPILSKTLSVSSLISVFHAVSLLIKPQDPWQFPLSGSWLCALVCGLTHSPLPHGCFGPGELDRFREICRQEHQVVCACPSSFVSGVKDCLASLFDI